MSDAAVLAVIQAMEAWMADPARPMDEPALAAWNHAFQTAVAQAERGPGWEALVARAHALVARVDAQRGAWEARRDAVRVELERQTLGDRALKGYGSSTR